MDVCLCGEVALTLSVIVIIRHQQLLCAVKQVQAGVGKIGVVMSDGNYHLLGQSETVIHVIRVLSHIVIAVFCGIDRIGVGLMGCRSRNVGYHDGIIVGVTFRVRPQIVY